jgi:cardiolipin synthase (CMP-forming)
LGTLEPGARRGEEVASPGTGAGAGSGGEGQPPDAGPFTIPNALTALRLLLAPVFLALHVRGEIPRALVVFAVAAATDLVDGLAARLLGQHSRLGEFLDPIADKLLAFCALVALTAAGRLPLWFIGVLVGRDAAQLSGALLLTALGRSVPMHPTRAGKYATFAVAGLVVGALLVDAGAARPEAAQPWLAAVGLLAAACVLVSLIQYGRIFARVLAAPPEPSHGR